MAQDIIGGAPNYKAECDRLQAELCKMSDKMRKMEEENHALKALLSDHERSTAVLGAQMDVVRLIFGGGNR